MNPGAGAQAEARSLVLRWFDATKRQPNFLATRDTGRRTRCRLTAAPTPTHMQMLNLSFSFEGLLPLTLRYSTRCADRSYRRCAGSEHFGANGRVSPKKKKKKKVLVAGKAKRKSFRCLARPLVFASHVVMFDSSALHGGPATACIADEWHRLSHSKPFECHQLLGTSGFYTG